MISVTHPHRTFHPLKAGPKPDLSEGMIRQERSVRFSGIVDQVSLERDEALVLQKKGELEKLTFEANGKQYNGLQMLSVLKEVAEYPKDLHPGKALLGLLFLGIPFCFKSFRQGVNYVPENAKPFVKRDNITRLFAPDREDLPNEYAQVDSRVHTLLYELKSLGILTESPTSATIWRFHQMGVTMLERFGQESRLTSQEQASTPASSPRVEQLKTLISIYSDGKSGWKQLKHIEALFDKKSHGVLSLFSTRDVTYGALLKHLQLSDIEEQSLIMDFRRQGFLVEVAPGGGKVVSSTDKSANPPQENSLWVLTPKARLVLQQGEPLEAASVNPTEWRGIIGMEVERLKSEKRERESGLIVVENKYNQALKGLEQLHKDLDALEHEAVTLFESSKKTIDFEGRAKLEQKAAEKAFDARCMQDKITLEQESAEKLKVQVQGTKTLLASWTRKTNQIIQQLLRVENQLKNVQVFKDITGLSEQLRQELPREGQVASMESNPVLASLSQALGDQYYKPQALADPSEIDVASRADQSHQSAMLEQSIRTIQARREQGGTLVGESAGQTTVDNPNAALEALAEKRKKAASS